MNQPQLHITGHVRIVVTGADGQVKDEREIKNLVVTAGKQFIAARMVGTPAVMSHMALGSGAAAAAADNTALGTELGRVALSTGTATGAIVTYTATFASGVATGAIVEAGVLNAASAGTMLCRTVFAVVNKGVDDAMSVTWSITVG